MVDIGIILRLKVSKAGFEIEEGNIKVMKELSIHTDVA